MQLKNYIKICLIVLVTTGIFYGCNKDDSGSSPVANALSPDSASGGALLTLTGTGLSDIRYIYFEKDSVPAPFNPNFNTNKALLFRVPDTANGGNQNIIFIKENGAAFTVPFKVIALPSVSGVSNYNFYPGDLITLTGNNLEDVSDITLQGTTTKVTVVNQSKKTLQLKMPDTEAGRVKLQLTNSSGQSTTSQEFVNIENAYPLFTDDYQNGVANNSWGPATTSTIAANVKTGTTSFAATYNQGNWSMDGFANWGSGIENLQSKGYKYLTFWVKGASVDYTLYLTCDGRPNAFGNSDRDVPVNVKAGIWNYYKLALSDIKLWSKDATFKQIGWWIEGPDSQNETFYFDDVLFVK